MAENGPLKNAGRERGLFRVVHNFTTIAEMTVGVRSGRTSMQRRVVECESHDVVWQLKVCFVSIKLRCGDVLDGNDVGDGKYLHVADECIETNDAVTEAIGVNALGNSCQSSDRVGSWNKCST